MNNDEVLDIDELVRLWQDKAEADAAEDDVWDGWPDEIDESMDGDLESGLASAGWGTDEDYGYYGEDY